MTQKYQKSPENEWPKECVNCGKKYKTRTGILKHVKKCIPDGVYYGSPGLDHIREENDGIVEVFGWV